jgi:polysaccharide chain length determinant protein (PEP-CTERM system associated)
MDSFIQEIFEHLNGIWRFRRIAMWTAWIVAVVGWIIVLAWPNSYQAQARVYVDTSTTLKPLLQGIAVDQDIDAQLNLVRESLLGRVQLSRVAHDTGLDAKAKTSEARDAIVAKLRAAISIDSVAAGASHEGRRSADSVYTISYRDARRDRALTVVRSLLNDLVKDALNGNPNDIDAAQKFLREQIAEYEKRLSASESTLADFKKRNVGLVPGAQGDYFSRLQTEISATSKARANLDTALRRREALVHQLRGESPLIQNNGQGAGGARIGVQVGVTDPAAQANPVGGESTSSRVAVAQARLDDLLLRFTERHPDVVAARATLEQLKVRQNAEIAAVRNGDLSGAVTTGLASNPVYQTSQVQLNQTDVEIAAARGELAEHERAEADLRRMVNTAPEVEAEFSRLNRDYDVTKLQYNALLDRLDKAKISDDAEKTGAVHFQVIDPPASPLEPVFPKRALLLVAGLFMGFGGGAGLAWLMNQLRPVFNRASTLREMTDLPVLGSISVSIPERARREFKESVKSVCFSGASLLIVFCVVFTFQRQTAAFLSVFSGFR